MKNILPNGWRRSIFGGVLIALLVLLCNIAALVYATLSYGASNGTVALFQGNCSKAQQLNTGLHLLINILSTGLLGASNYAMQCISAPTRAEIDKAHRKKIWLDVGILSFRNLWHIHPKKVVLWVVLILSSLPVHLFYNSSIYSSTYAQNYWVYGATDAMIQSHDNRTVFGFTNYTDYGYAIEEGNVNYGAAFLIRDSIQSGRYTRLENKDCIAAYETDYPGSYGNVVLVTNDSTHLPANHFVEVNSVGTGVSGYGSLCIPNIFGWICGNTASCGLRDTPRCTKYSVDPSSWAPQKSMVAYCLSEILPERCSVKLSQDLAYVVIAFNCIKLIALAIIAFAMKENPILTVGDAITSFLQTSDPTTRDLCLLDKAKVELWSTEEQNYQESNKEPMILQESMNRWSSGISTRRWVMFIILYLSIIALCISLLIYGLVANPAGPSQVFSLGLGEANAITYIPDIVSNSVSFVALISNLPQLVLSSIYYFYNSIFTCFMICVEWNQYSYQRKSLRVTDSPRGQQRSSYVLQLPKRWALPLIVVSAILHWLCSQSLFLVSLTQVGGNFTNQSIDQTKKEELFTSGYSAVAILATAILGVALFILIICLGRRKLSNKLMPLAGSCSAAISAACHHSVYDEKDKTFNSEVLELGMETLPVQWGEIEHEGDNTRPSHCGFSSRQVTQPIVGRLYR